MKETGIKLSSKKSLYNQVLFLDGMARAGKFLLGKICSHFERVEYFQNIPTLEHIPILNNFDLIEKSAAKSMMQVILDHAIYDMSIGRGLNQRSADSSSITHSFEYQHYLHRSNQQDGAEAISKIQEANRLPSFLIHNCLPFINFFFETFPYLQMVHIERHPIDLAHSWLLKGWGRRFGVDPLAFEPTIHGKDVPVPWHAKTWQAEYGGMSEADRAIKSVCTIYRLSNEGFNNLNNKLQSKILKLSYEEFFSDPISVVNQLAGFLESQPSSHMKEVLKMQGCYRDIPIDSRKEKFKELSKQASSGIIEDLTKISLEYESVWRLETFF